MLLNQCSFFFFPLVLFLNVEVCFSCQPEDCYTNFNKNFKKQNAKGTEKVPWYSKAIYTENLLNITPFPTSFQNLISQSRRLRSEGGTKKVEFL